MTVEEALCKYYGDRAQYAGGQLYRIGNRNVQYSGGQLYKVGEDRIQFAGGRLYKVGANSVRYWGNDICEIGSVKIQSFPKTEKRKHPLRVLSLFSPRVDFGAQPL